MRISSIKSFSWLAVNRHHLLSNGAVITTQRQARQYRIHNRRRFVCDYERDTAPSESRRWRFTANQETDFTDEMHIIEFD